MAQRRLAQNPLLRGHGLAKAGLILGYASLGLYLAAALLLLVFGRSLAISTSAGNTSSFALPSI